MDHGLAIKKTAAELARTRQKSVTAGSAAGRGMYGVYGRGYVPRWTTVAKLGTRDTSSV